MEKLVIIYNLMVSSTDEMARCWYNKLIEMIAEEAREQGKAEQEVHAALLAMIR